MKFSFSWLSDLVDITMPADKLAEFLSLHAFETEVSDKAQVFENIIVAKVTKIDKHPNADRLRVIELSDGQNKIAPVVCGAWNFDVGAVVALALPGAVIPHDQHDPAGKPFTLSKATIRGVESQGMICSAKELGLSEEGSGILLLDQKQKLGESFTVKHQAKEILLDISVPANRPDLLSYRGVAWEIAALTGKKYKVKPLKSLISNLKSQVLKVRISEPKLCSQYLGVRLTNVKVAPSPKFIQERLKSSGLRPINNVVDITNYVLLELGQPLHAFDASKVTGAINVRKAYLNEKIKTLDGVERKLTPEMLVIADSKKALAVAGVMGGAESAVSANTTEIILEAANFNAVSVRRTSKALGLRTDASVRFEKSLPIAFAKLAAEYASELLQQHASAKALEFAAAGVKNEKPHLVKLDFDKVNQLLGTSLSATEQKKILTKLGFTLHATRSTLSVQVPFWRPDVSIWQDLAEEVGRVLGLDKIKPTLISLASSQLSDRSLEIKDQAIDILVGLGYDEIYTYSFVSAQDLARWGIRTETAIEVENPISQDQQFLRPNLSLNVLKVAEHNAEENSQEAGKYFEIGNSYWLDRGEIMQKTHLCMLTFPLKTKRIQNLVQDFTELADRLGIDFELKQTHEQQAQIVVGGKILGHIGTVSGTSKLDWAGISLDFEEFIKHRKPKQFQLINKFPKVSMDMSILVREEIPWAEIRKVIHGAKEKLVTELELLEGAYKGKEISPGKKGMTFRVVYQAPNRTLKSEEASDVHKQIQGLLKQKFNAQIRD